MESLHHMLIMLRFTMNVYVKAIKFNLGLNKKGKDNNCKQIDKTSFNHNTLPRSTITDVP